MPVMPALSLVRSKASRAFAAHHLVLGAEFIHAREDLIVLGKIAKGPIVLGHHNIAAIHIIERDAAQGEATHLHGLAGRRCATVSNGPCSTPRKPVG